MSEVLAGAMAGIVMGVLTIGIGALALPSLRDWGPLKALLPAGQILFITFPTAQILAVASLVMALASNPHVTLFTFPIALQ